MPSARYCFPFFIRLAFSEPKRVQMKKSSRRRNKSLLAKAIGKKKDKKPILTKPLQESLIQCLEYHPSKRISKTLPRTLLMHLSHGEAVESIYVAQSRATWRGLSTCGMRLKTSGN